MRLSVTVSVAVAVSDTRTLKRALYGEMQIAGLDRQSSTRDQACASVSLTAM